MRLLKLAASLFLCTCATSSFAQLEGAKEVYKSPKMESEIPKHKAVAILPFNATIVYKRPPKNYDADANKAEEKSLSGSLQSSMYTFLLRKSDNYTCSFQDVERTNALLKQSGVYDKLDEITQDSLCKILKVDAAIKCKYVYEKTASEGGAIAKTILFGGLGSKTGSGGLTMQVYNGSDGELLWRFYKAMNDDVFSSSDQLIERMMRKVSRNFPYSK